MPNYEDPRWQKLRLRVFDRDDWKCVACQDASSTLVAHHKRYCGEIWESPPEDLQTLCKCCHEDLGKHPKSGVWWVCDQIGGRLLGVDHCPRCAGLNFRDEGTSFTCLSCNWNTAIVSAAVSMHAQILKQQKQKPVLFGKEIRSVYLAGKIADPWRDVIVGNGESGDWSHANHGICSGNMIEEDGSWNVVRGCVNVPGCTNIDLTGPYWNTDLDEWAGHGHAGLVAKHAPQTHACGGAQDWHSRMATMARCRRAINRCDLFFAWIDSMDAYGTLVEIGLAVKCNCKIAIGFGPRTNFDLWFAASLSDTFLVASGPLDAWSRLWSDYRDAQALPRNVATVLSAYAGVGVSEVG